MEEFEVIATHPFSAQGRTVIPGQSIALSAHDAHEVTDSGRARFVYASAAAAVHLALGLAPVRATSSSQGSRAAAQSF